MNITWRHTNDGGLQVDEDGARDVQAALHLAEEGVEGVGAVPDGVVRGHEAIRSDAMLQAVELPAGVAYLDASLAHVDAHTLTLETEGGGRVPWRSVITILCFNPKTS